VDSWDSTAFSGIFLASSFSTPKQSQRPNQQLVTQAVNIKYSLIIDRLLPNRNCAIIRLVIGSIPWASCFHLIVNVTKGSVFKRNHREYR